MFDWMNNLPVALKLRVIQIVARIIVGVLIIHTTYSVSAGSPAPATTQPAITQPAIPLNPTQLVEGITTLLLILTDVHLHKKQDAEKARAPRGRLYPERPAADQPSSST